jgi:hypothetical protein
MILMESLGMFRRLQTAPAPNSIQWNKWYSGNHHSNKQNTRTLNFWKWT